MSYLTYVAFRRNSFGLGGLILWEAVWLGVAIVSLAPRIFEPLTGSLHLARVMDLVVVTGMLVLGAVTYRTYVAVQRLQRKLERLVRAQALATLEGDGSRSSADDVDPKTSPVQRP